jgi:hypothetical protein
LRDVPPGVDSHREPQLPGVDVRAAHEQAREEDDDDGDGGRVRGQEDVVAGEYGRRDENGDISPVGSFTEPREKSRLSDIVEVLYIIYNVCILNMTCDTCRWTRLDNGRGGG